MSREFKNKFYTYFTLKLIKERFNSLESRRKSSSGMQLREKALMKHFVQEKTTKYSVASKKCNLIIPAVIIKL